MKTRKKAVEIIKNVLKNHYNYPEITIIQQLEDSGYIKFNEDRTDSKLHKGILEKRAESYGLTLSDYAKKVNNGEILDKIKQK